MFASIRRHQNWIWFFVVIIVIVSFVIFFSPNVRWRGVGATVDFGSINGKPISREEFNGAYHELRLYLHLNSRGEEEEKIVREMGPQLERETYNRLVLAEKLKEFKVEVTPKATVEWIRQHFGDPNTKAVDVTALKRQLQPYTLDDLERFAEHEVGRQHLISLFGLSGKLITPQEAEHLYRRENQPLAVEVAVFSLSNLLASVSVTPAALGQFYTNNMPDYRVPPRIQVAYVKFDVTNALPDDAQILKRLKEVNPQLAAMTNVSEAVDRILASRGTNAFKDEFDQPLAPEAAKQKIKDNLRKEVAKSDAQKNAMDFINALFEGREKNLNEKELLEKLAAAKGLGVAISSPFDERNGPKELHVPPLFAKTAFTLTEDDPYASTPVSADDAVYVLGLKRRFPSEVQSLDLIREKVALDYQRAEAMKLAQQAGEKFQAAVTNGLAQGKTFAAIGAETKVKTIGLPPFSASTRSPPEADAGIDFSVVQNIAARLSPGKSSPFVDTEHGGVVVYLKERLPVDETKLKAELPSYLAKYREQRQMMAFNDWFQKQQQASLNIPRARER